VIPEDESGRIAMGRIRHESKKLRASLKESFAVRRFLGELGVLRAKI
jgi:hypothetical protein